MVPFGSLLLPILIATVLVFVASFILWAVLPHHNWDWKGLPNEDEVRKTMRDGGVQPGQYTIPHVPDKKQMRDAAVQQKFNDGPVGFLYVAPSGFPAMGGKIGTQFVFQLLVTAAVAYIASRVLMPHTEYMRIFKFTAAVSFLAYGAASIPGSIWFARSWKGTFKELIDALVYAGLTAGTFGWLWPEG